MKFYGQFNPPVDRVVFDRYGYIFAAQRGYFVESGAFDGVTESNCKFLEESLGWQGINVEPVPHLFHLLSSNRPRSKNVNCALASCNGVAQFKHAIHPTWGTTFGNGSLKHTDHHREILEAEGCQFETINVATKTYDEVIRESGFPRIDFFSLDVEGCELEVLAGMQNPIFHPRLLCVETGHDPERKIDQRLKEMGYRKDSEYLVNSFYLRSAA